MLGVYDDKKILNNQFSMLNVQVEQLL